MSTAGGAAPGAPVRDYHFYHAMVIEASQKVRPADSYVALSVDYNDGRFRFVIWAASQGGRMNTVRLDAEYTSQERLEAHLRGFVDAHREEWADVPNAFGEAPEAAGDPAPRAI